MKRTISLLLAIITACTMLAGLNLSAYAASVSNVQLILKTNKFVENTGGHYVYKNGKADYYKYDYTVYGMNVTYSDKTSKHYYYTDWGTFVDDNWKNEVTDFQIIDTQDTNHWKVGTNNTLTFKCFGKTVYPKVTIKSKVKSLEYNPKVVTIPKSVKPDVYFIDNSILAVYYIDEYIKPKDATLKINYADGSSEVYRNAPTKVYDEHDPDGRTEYRFVNDNSEELPFGTGPNELNIDVTNNLVSDSVNKLNVSYGGVSCKIDVKMYSGCQWVKTDDGSCYYYQKDGSYRKGWLQYGGKWYYFGKNGVMQKGWVKVGGKWYLFNNSGVMQTGWQKSGKKWYYMNKSGAMTTGWQKVGKTWYYMNKSGVMTTGWQKVSSKWYYMNSDGSMRTANLNYRGKTYRFNSSGVCLNP